MDTSAVICPLTQKYMNVVVLQYFLHYQQAYNNKVHNKLMSKISDVISGDKKYKIH